MFYISFHGSGPPPSRAEAGLAESQLQRRVHGLRAREHDGAAAALRLAHALHPGAHLEPRQRERHALPGSRAAAYLAARGAAKYQRQPLTRRRLSSPAFSGSERMSSASPRDRQVLQQPGRRRSSPSVLDVTSPAEGRAAPRPRPIPAGRPAPSSRAAQLARRAEARRPGPVRRIPARAVAGGQAPRSAEGAPSGSNSAPDTAAAAPSSGAALSARPPIAAGSSETRAIASPPRPALRQGAAAALYSPSPRRTDSCLITTPSASTVTGSAAAVGSGVGRAGLSSPSRGPRPVGRRREQQHGEARPVKRLVRFRALCIRLCGLA